MTKKRYATCVCETCYVKLPKNEAHYEDVTEETGGWKGYSDGFYSGGGNRSYKNNYGTFNYGSSRSSSTSRTYYKHRRIWYCIDCYNNLLEERKQEAERERIAKEQRRPFIIFIWLCIIIFFVILIAKP